MTVTMPAREVDVADVEAAQLGHPQSAPVEELEHGVVAAVAARVAGVDRSRRRAPRRRRAPGRTGAGRGTVEHGLELAPVEHPRQPGPPPGDGQPPGRVDVDDRRAGADHAK